MTAAEFYKNLTYSNDIEYVENNVNLNILASEITNKNILDYGCGTGDASYIFNKYSPLKITGIDIGESNIYTCNKRKSISDNMLFINGDLNIFDLGDSKYDLIWSVSTIEFLEQDIDYVIQSFKVAIKKGGILYLSFTKRNLVNILLYKILYFIKRVSNKNMSKLLYILILLRYRISGLKIKNKDNIKNKSKYLFVPFIRLISDKEILEALTNHNFKVLYLRDKIKPDLNSPTHTELKAVFIDK